MAFVARAAPVPETYHIRIPKTAFNVSTFTFLAIAFLLAIFRTVLRLIRNRTLLIDDYLLIFACCCLGATLGVAWTIKDLVYTQIYVGLGWEAPPADFVSRMLVFEQRDIATTALIWAAIYAVKFSFLFFFKKLVHRIKPLEIQWWIVFGFLLAGAGVTIPLALIICSHLNEDYLTYCPLSSQPMRDTTYLQVSCSLDVFTDVLLISIPIRLLWKLQMPLRKKIIIGSMFSLSIFMIIIAIVRTSLAPLPNGVIDIPWIIFWHRMEATVAVSMVSITAVRGLFGSEVGGRSSRKKNSNGRSYEMDGPSSLPTQTTRDERVPKRLSLYDLEGMWKGHGERL